MKTSNKLFIVFFSVVIILMIVFNADLGAAITKASKIADNYTTVYYIDRTKAYFELSKNTTKTELEKVADEFKREKNIDIDFSATTFYENEKLKFVDLKIMLDDGTEKQSAALEVASSRLRYGKIVFEKDYLNPGKIILEERIQKMPAE